MIKRLLLNFNVLLIGLFIGQQSFSQKVYAYITNQSGNSLSVIDVSTKTVIGTINLGAGTNPYAVAVLPNGNAYIADNGTNSVTLFSTTANTITGTIAVGSGPLSIAASPNGNRVYVSNTTDGTVSVINTATNAVIATVTVGGNPQGIVVSPDNSKVYVSDGVAGVAVIDAVSNTFLSTISTGASTLPKGVAITSDGQYLYVALSNTGQVGVYKTSDGSQFVSPITVDGGTTGVAISPDGTKVYVTNSSGSISVIRTSDNTLLTTIPDGGGNQPLGVSFTPDGTEAYVVNYGAGNVSVINTGTSSITNTIAVGTNPTSFSSFIATVPYTLALRFSSFTAQELFNHTIQLSWTVQEQTYGTQYEVEGSTDGVSFFKKSLVNATSASSASYSWTDAAAALGTNFYRIKSMEASGKASYSQILRLTVGSSSSTTLIYPNPIRERSFTLQLNNQSPGLYSLELINTLGQKVFRSGLNYNGGSSAQTVTLPQSVSKGNYQVIVRKGNVQNILKLIIE